MKTSPYSPENSPEHVDRRGERPVGKRLDPVASGVGRARDRSGCVRRRTAVLMVVVAGFGGRRVTNGGAEGFRTERRCRGVGAVGEREDARREKKSL